MSATMIESLKQAGKQIGWVRRLNGHLKCTRLKREYDQTVLRYSSIPSQDDSVGRLTGRIAHKFQQLALRNCPRVFFLGTDELQDRSGILQALERLAKLTYFTRADGGYGQNYIGSDDERRRTNSERLLAVFMDMAQAANVPEILLAQTWAGYVDPRIFDQIKKQYGSIIINIAMDDRHQYWGKKVGGKWWGTRGLIPSLDLALTAAPECVEWYEKEGCPAMFFPEASDPSIFHPMPELPKIHEVCFVGSRYGIRDKIVKALRRAGIHVAAYGVGWNGGRLETKDVPRLFAQSKIVLGVGTIGHCEDFYALKMRDFDGPMSGSCYVTHDNPDLRFLYKVGDEITTYRSVDECVNVVKWYLSHEEERERVARAGHARALADHTWGKRFNDLFNVLRKGLNSREVSRSHPQT